MRLNRRVLVFVGFSLVAVALALPATAQTPPFPDFFYPYGRALVGGQNLSPEVQPVLAFVNGNLCGSAMTEVAPATNPQTGQPEPDAGKTVYVVNVLHDGNGDGQRPGCGHPGDPVTLYFPEGHLIGATKPAFQSGSGARVDQNLVPLSFRVAAPLAARD